MKLYNSDICNESVKARTMEIIDLNYNSIISPLAIKDIRVIRNEYDRSIHICLRALFVQGEVKTSSREHWVNIPKTWWDMFKIRYFPKWAIKKWPPIYYQINTINNYNTYNVCPHLVTDPKATHVQFLDFGEY